MARIMQSARPPLLVQGGGCNYFLRRVGSCASMPVSKLSTLLRLILAASLTAGASSAKPADVKAGAGHYTTHLRAGGEREPPAAIGRAAGSLRPVQTNQWYSSLLFEAWPHPL